MENKSLEEIIKIIRERHPGIIIESCQDPIVSHLTHIKMLWVNEEREHLRGFASDYDFKLAVIKAYSELIERYALNIISKSNRTVTSSNGFASHINFELAKERSICELIERDSFLLSWLGKKAPHWFSDSKFYEIGLGELLTHRLTLRDYGLDFKIGLISITEKKYYTVIGSLISNNNEIGFAIDTCTDSNFVKAVNSVAQGLFYYATLIINRKTQDLPLFKDISLSEVRNPEDHLEYYLNPKNQNHSWFLEGSSHVLKLDLPPIHSEEYPGGPDLKVVRSHSPFMQQYFCGLTSMSKLNLGRIGQIIQNLSFLNLSLHPLP